MGAGFYLVFIAAMTFGSAAAAFENIEVDALYQRAIQEAIRAEFETGLKLLKAQADSLMVQVREKDIKAMQTHLYEKAYLMARCADKTVTHKKMVSDSILVEPSVKTCIQTHMKFIQKFHFAGKTSEMKCLMNSEIFVTDKAERPYDFLRLDTGMSPGNPRDYVRLKECLDSRTESEMQLDQILR